MKTVIKIVFQVLLAIVFIYGTIWLIAEICTKA